MISLQKSIANATRAFSNFAGAFFRLRRSTRRWRMQNKNGRNKSQRKRDQVKLRGRRCREHKGLYPSRGKPRRKNL